ncbi:MAG TPA: 7-cyano-7-deazaguanine synthase QueC [Fimbriimonadaceae bacterium]|nr:7-cyano-7-deazaguanine synthase QueC [Fimbriimonadaceae bacterium]
MKRPAVVLLSGGLDSATALAIARQEFEPYALTVVYGQRHAVEIEAAKRVAQALGAKAHKIVGVDLAAIGGSALTDDIDVPKDREDAGDIPVTYVPARNTIMLALALGYAETLEADHIFVGVNAVDYSGYPDCRPEFVEAFERLANLATKRGVEGHRLTIHAPLIHLTKPQIIRRGLDLGVDYSLTHSCYDPAPSGRACGHCDSCLIRKRAFEELGMVDPALA